MRNSGTKCQESPKGMNSECFERAVNSNRRSKIKAFPQKMSDERCTADAAVGKEIFMAENKEPGGSKRPERYKLYDRFADKVPVGTMNIIVIVVALLLLFFVIYGIATATGV